MKSDFIPDRDSEFETWASNFSTYLTAHQASLPIPEMQVAEVGSTVTQFRGGLNSHVAAKDAAHAACELKDVVRKQAEDVIRMVARQIQASPDVTDVQREAMGLPVHDGIRTLSATLDITQPYGLVDTSKRLRHLIKYRDSASSESRARPEYAAGCEIWCAITAAGAPAPAEMAAYRNLGMNSASPFAVEYDMTDGGKNAHYMLRWIGKDGTKGPWSEILTATIVG